MASETTTGPSSYPIPVDLKAIARDPKEALAFLRLKCAELLLLPGAKPMERVVALKLLAETLRLR
ncbi:MAG: hypothetical protein IPN34_03905 [Planctomycetes bacterium]|nr:hypothetical protein [Planctomycetota bacterium]